MHARVVVYMYLIFVMTGQNISNDGDKGMQICTSQTFIDPASIREYKFGMHQCWMHVSATDRQNTPVPLKCLLKDVLDGWTTKVS